MTSIFNTHYNDNLLRVNSRAKEPNNASRQQPNAETSFGRVLADLEKPAPVPVSELAENTLEVKPEPKAASVPARIELAISNLTSTEQQQEQIVGRVAYGEKSLACLVKNSSAESLLQHVKFNPESVKQTARDILDTNQLIQAPKDQGKAHGRAPSAPALLEAKREGVESAPAIASLGVPPSPELLDAAFSGFGGEPAVVATLPGFSEGNNQTKSSMKHALAALEREQARAGFSEIRSIIEKAGKHHGIDPHLSMAIAKAESDFRVNVTSRDGHSSKGLFQLLDSTGRDMLNHTGLEEPYQPFNPNQNAFLGVGYLRRLHDIFSAETNLGFNMKTVPATSAENLEKIAIAAYNAGEGNVARAQSRAAAIGKDPSEYSAIEPFLPASTRDYVKRVSGLRETYAMAESRSRTV